MPIRPPSLGICGIVMIIFGTMALMNLVTAGVGQGMSAMPQANDNPLATAVQQSADFRFYKKMLLVPTLLTGILGVAAGIGVLKGREWARKAGLLWSVLYLAVGMAGSWASIACMRPVVATLPLPPSMTPEMFEAMRHSMMTSSLIAAGFTTVFFLAAAIVMIVLLTRPAVVAFCTMKPFDR